MFLFVCVGGCLCVDCPGLLRAPPLGADIPYDDHILLAGWLTYYTGGDGTRHSCRLPQRYSLMGIWVFICEQLHEGCTISQVAATRVHARFETLKVRT